MDGLELEEICEIHEKTYTHKKVDLNGGNKRDSKNNKDKPKVIVNAQAIDEQMVLIRPPEVVLKKSFDSLNSPRPKLKGSPNRKTTERPQKELVDKEERYWCYIVLECIPKFR